MTDPTSDYGQALEHHARRFESESARPVLADQLGGRVPHDNRWHRRPGRRLVRADVVGHEWRKVGRLRWLLAWGGR